MRALETSVRTRADFVTCVSPAEEAFFHATRGTAPIALVSQQSTATFVDALVRAQLTRSDAGRILPA
jgi:hypothetical protein